MTEQPRSGNRWEPPAVPVPADEQQPPDPRGAAPNPRSRSRGRLRLKVAAAAAIAVLGAGAGGYAVGSAGAEGSSVPAVHQLGQSPSDQLAPASGNSAEVEGEDAALPPTSNLGDD